MKEILLTQGQAALVDDEDFAALSEHKWFAHWSRNMQSFYAARSPKVDGKSKHVSMARTILQTPKGLFADHVNGNTLDNRRSNLRNVTPRQNVHNCKIRITNKSGFRGVHFAKKWSVWIASICINGKKTHLGSFKTPAEAAEAYDKAALEHRGEFAKVNN